MTKTCKDCELEKSLDDFQYSYNNKRGKRYPMAICKACRSARRRNNPHERAQNVAHKRERYADPGFRQRMLSQQAKSKYGMSHEDRDAMLAAQGGGCAICGVTQPPGRGWCIDHDHSCCPGPKSCGKCVRGILCCNCNCLLGQAKDDPGRLLAAIEYLRKAPA